MSPDDPFSFGQEPQEQPPRPEEYELSIRGVRAQEGEHPGEMLVELNTTRGAIEMFLQPVEGKTGCAVFIGGAAGGVDGPANQVYVRLAQSLTGRGVSSLRVRYRNAGDFEECVLDALAACSFLKGIGAERAVLVGHSFGGAVAIKAGELGGIVNAVVSMSSQRFGTHDVQQLGKPLLLIHGSRDDVLDRAASDDIFERAIEPKQLVILEGAGHGLLEAADDVFNLLNDFIASHAGDDAPPRPPTPPPSRPANPN